MQLIWLSMMVIAVSEFHRTVGQCLPEQKSLLFQMRNNLTYDSSLSTKLVRWNDGTDCCRWRGVLCDIGGRVIGLDLAGESISGTIDDSNSIFRLRFLRRLSLAQNSFDYSSQLSAGFGKLTELNYLNLSETDFGGQIPGEFSRLSRLVTLDLSTYSTSLLKLENPNLKMFIQNLSKLRELRLDGVDIAAQGNSWCQVLSSSLPDLQVLSLINCNTSHPPDSSLGKLQSLSVIRLDQNPFSAPIPDFFGDFPNLTFLSLSACNMLGKSPQKIFQVPTLKKIDLSNNRELGGSLPEFSHNGSLEDLNLSFTQFSGDLPASIGKLRMLTRLELFGCNFSGRIPSSMSNLSQLVHLGLSMNGFSGSLPSLSRSKNLATILLAGNMMMGTIPPDWKALKNLWRLDLSDNSLSGLIPQYLFALPSLNSLNLANNQLSGQINEPEDASPSPLESLDLRGNRLEGPFPHFLFNIRSLFDLSLASNKLTGLLELVTFTKLENLTNLDLSYNNLSVGTSGSYSEISLLPKLNSLMLASCKLKRFPFLKNQSRMNMLDLSDNQIRGEIPNWVWELHDGYLPFVNLSHNEFTGLQKPYRFTFHQYLDLHANQLRGQIPLPPRAAVFIDFSNNKFDSPLPADIGNYLSSAILFKIADSGIVDGIPLSLCNSTRLQVLDMSANNLTSSIPSCLIELSRILKVINLRENKLSGNIPDIFPQDCALETLDLSYNLLEGPIPKSLINCSKLKVLNLGNNRMNDSFPCWSKNLSDLRVLVLHSNSFHGDISCPGVKSSWLNLQIIHIASNNFQGVLPPDFFLDLTAMMVNYFNSSLQLDYLHYQAGVYRVYYQDSITMNYKGNPSAVVKILSALTSIDVSSNNFRGQIPETVGDLRSLRLLNLSNNAFADQIPWSVGNLTHLEALDLSLNKLSGKIPEQLGSLTFLNFLNLSYNHLEGRIPGGNQMHTFGESSFAGNERLCGFPLNQTCKNATATVPPQPTFEDQKQEYFKRDVYVSAAIGFLFGLGVILWPLWISRRCRKCFDTIFDKLISRIFDQPKHVHFLSDDW
ncbi:hypothetical protein M9H77_22612 [Catharanthus roseus]|uniref:Uncharacterized protein n=1 Tax=Catharanthus roseus TaxID=4058 RepID=A0ACC0ARW4_CATRO|nr:hypothetical protein M9H77_22612 [Catharanthus roseus]